MTSGLRRRGLELDFVPRRQQPSCVMTQTRLESLMRSTSACERSRRRRPCAARRCARRRAGRWRARAPCPCRSPPGRPSSRPSDFSTLANFETSRMQLLIGERADVARLAFPDDGGLVAAPGGEMAVEAVVREVELAADEPLRPRARPIRGPSSKARTSGVPGRLFPRMPRGRGRLRRRGDGIPRCFRCGLWRRNRRADRRGAFPAGWTGMSCASGFCSDMDHKHHIVLPKISGRRFRLYSRMDEAAALNLQGRKRNRTGVWRRRSSARRVVCWPSFEGEFRTRSTPRTCCRTFFTNWWRRIG